MAEINFSCQNCGQNIVADSAAAGLSADCPNCGQALTIPLDASRMFEPQVGDGSREALHQAQTELAYVREQLEAFTEQCDRLHSNAAHTQVELKSFQNERMVFRAELTRLRLRVAEAEDELIVRAREQAQWESERAEHERVREALAMDLQVSREHALTLHQQLANKSAELSSAEQALEKARLSEQTLTSQMDHLAAKNQAGEESFRALELEKERLARDLALSENGAEVARLSTRLAQAEDAERLSESQLREVRSEGAKAASDREELQRQLRETQQQLAFAQERAEARSENALFQDNQLLREILARQNGELEERQKELSRLKLARFGLRILYAAITAGLVGVLWIGLQFLTLIEPG